MMKSHISAKLAILVFCIVALLAIPPVLASPVQGTVPGTVPNAPREFSAVTPHTVVKDGLSTMVTMIGKINISAGGVGFITASAPLNVWKTPGTTVLAAYMTSATIPGQTETPGDVLIDGSPVTFTSFSSSNF